MSASQIVFLVAALVTIFAAVMVVSVRRIMHAALWLVLALMGVAVLMALLETRFFAIIQLLVYIGAIAILIIVGVMLTRRIMDDHGAQIHRAWWVALLAALLLYSGLLWVLSQWGQANTSQRAVAPGGEDLVAFGQALVDPAGFVIPFEVASILLLASMVGAIFIAFERKERRA